jgi:hypothetical protein
MLKEKNYLFQRLNQLLDFLLIVVAFFVALWSRNRFVVPYIFPYEPIISADQHHWLLWIMAPVMILAQKYAGVYNSQRLRRPQDLFLPILGSAAIATAVAIVLVMGLARTVGPGLSIISLPQIPYFALWIVVLLMAKTIAMRRFFLPCAGEASTSAISSLWGAAPSSSRFLTSSRVIPSGVSASSAF